MNTFHFLATFTIVHAYQDSKVDQYTQDVIGKLAREDSKGYILEVDVRYSKELHGLHNELPFMCDKMEMNYSL